MSRPRHCTTCGSPESDCACAPELDPPRYCPVCGRRLRVVVTPIRWTAECRDHGPIAQR